jgi:hypothetical protein
MPFYKIYVSLSCLLSSDINTEPSVVVKPFTCASGGMSSYQDKFFRLLHQIWLLRLIVKSSFAAINPEHIRASYS